MKIAVLSGKGGTGKTLISVNLSCAAKNALYIDCDVEEPNGHLFFKPEQKKAYPISVTVPDINYEKCTGCHKCVDFCEYNALAMIKGRLMVFYEVCHSCGGCIIVCPQKALTEKKREIGAVTKGISEDTEVFTGCLNTGEVSGVPIIKELLSDASKRDVSVIDCPPGSACVVMESIRDVDFCVLVAEPTVFGAHNLSMVYELVKLFDKPFGVVLNKCVDGENPSEKFCVDNNIEILLKIPYDEELARINSNGVIAVRESEKYREVFKKLLGRIKVRCSK